MNEYQAKPDNYVFTIWIISDNRRGHENQSLAISEAISRLIPTKVFLLNSPNTLTQLSDLAFSKFKSTSPPSKPDLIIGTGHGTHLSLFNAKRRYGGKALVIMSPSLPLSMFDFALIPLHDQPPNNDKVIPFKGAFSRVTPSIDKRNKSLCIVVGGPSKHYSLDQTLLLKEIQELTADLSDDEILISNSPRSPKALSKKLSEKYPFCFIDWKKMESGEIQSIFSYSARIWITEDSVSMIFDALSSGAQVGLLTSTRKKETKVSKEIQSLLNDQFLTNIKEWRHTKNMRPSPLLNESDRCAQIILAKMGRI